MFAGNLIESLDNVFAKYRAAVLANEIPADQVAAMIQGIAQVCKCSKQSESVAVEEVSAVDADNGEG